MCDGVGEERKPYCEGEHGNEMFALVEIAIFAHIGKVRRPLESSFVRH